MTSEMSVIDIKILEQIQKDASLSTGELADKVGVSQSPCWRRLQRLKDEGYITRQVAILDRSKFGSSMYVFARMKMASLSDEQRAEFVRKVENIPEILECYTMFGDMDVMIKVFAHSMDWYQKFIFKTVLKLPGVVEIQSTVTLGEIKYTTAIPIRNDQAH